MWIKFTQLKDDFFSRFLRLSVFPWCKDKPQIVMLWWEWLGRSKWRATGLDASVFSEAVLQSSPLFTYVDYAGYAIDDICADVCEVVSDFSGSIGSWDLNHVRKGHLLHRVRLHLKVPDWLSDLNALLTRKLPMFLSRFNEISGGALAKCWRSKRQLSKSFTVEIEPLSTRLIKPNFGGALHRHRKGWGWIPVQDFLSLLLK